MEKGWERDGNDGTDTDSDNGDKKIEKCIEKNALVLY